MNKTSAFVLILAALSFSLAACNGGNGGEEDTDVQVDQPTEDTRTDDVTAEEGPGDPLQEDTATEQETPDELPPDVVEEDAAEEELPTTQCGNGAVDSGEVCDDGNTTTEFCGAGCLGDCSLNAANCGNGTLDPGEACDSTGTCTSSCTMDGHNIGDACSCENDGANLCNDRDFHAGRITGCESVAIPEGSGGLLTCLRSINDTMAGYQTYYAGGYCTIMAVACEGAFCSLVPTFGDLDTFACPEGFYLNEDSRVIMGTTITSKSCMKLCAGDADCRWNEQDTFWHACGQYECLPVPGDPSVSVCMDGRMLATP